MLFLELHIFVLILEVSELVLEGAEVALAGAELVNFLGQLIEEVVLMLTDDSRDVHLLRHRHWTVP